jgi:hypothetical protein
MRVPPLDDGGPAKVSLAHSGGLAGWQVALVVIATTLVVTMVAVVLVRARSRGKLSPAVR